MSDPTYDRARVELRHELTAAACFAVAVMAATALTLLRWAWP